MNFKTIRIRILPVNTKGVGSARYGAFVVQEDSEGEIEGTDLLDHLQSVPTQEDAQRLAAKAFLGLAHSVEFMHGRKVATKVKRMSSKLATRSR